MKNNKWILNFLMKQFQTIVDGKTIGRNHILMDSSSNYIPILGSGEKW